MQTSELKKNSLYFYCNFESFNTKNELYSFVVQDQSGYEFHCIENGTSVYLEIDIIKELIKAPDEIEIKYHKYKLLEYNDYLESLNDKMNDKKADLDDYMNSISELKDKYPEEFI